VQHHHGDALPLGVRLFLGTVFVVLAVGHAVLLAQRTRDPDQAIREAVHIAMAGAMVGMVVWNLDPLVFAAWCIGFAAIAGFAVGMALLAGAQDRPVWARESLSALGMAYMVNTIGSPGWLNGTLFAGFAGLALLCLGRFRRCVPSAATLLAIGAEGAMAAGMAVMFLVSTG
jgi:hypothetical protein